MKNFALLGNNLKHTISPLIHNTRFAELKLNAKYSVLDIGEDELCKELLSEFDGLNITIPYKQKVINYLESLSDKAQAIGAVNTIVNNGKLVGYNTDIVGFEYTAKKCNANLTGNVLVLGFGGVAQTVIYAIKKTGGNVTVATRQKELAIDNIKFVGYDDKIVLDKFNVIVNCSPVGMYPNINACPLAKFDCDCVIDLIYNPNKTKLIKSAESRNIRAIGGLDMLIVQALESEKLWLGVDYNEKAVESLKKTCLEALN